MPDVLQMGDFNGDGRPDLLISSNRTQLLLNTSH